jgi:hypothetical protein
MRANVAPAPALLALLMLAVLVVPLGSGAPAVAQTGGFPEAVVDDVVLEAVGPGIYGVRTTIRNSGEVAFVPQGQSLILDAEGGELARFELPSGESLPPGESRTVDVAVWTAPDGFAGTIEAAVRLAEPNARGSARLTIAEGEVAPAPAPPAGAAPGGTPAEDEPAGAAPPGDAVPGPDQPAVEGDAADPATGEAAEAGATDDGDGGPGALIIGIAVLLLLLCSGLIAVAVRRRQAGAS